MADLSTESVALHTGAVMPALGLGTWQLTGGDARTGIEHALELGYRLVDTADDYFNQAEVGAAIRASPLDRDQVFLTSKVEEDEDAYEGTEARLRDLGEDYLDLCLIHRPPPDGAGEDLWEGLLEARSDGLIRDAGVSNYTAEQVDRICEETGEPPTVNQLEWTPFGHSAELLAHHRELGVVVQAYSPLTRARRLGDAVVGEIASAHGRSPAQVLLRWALQLGTPPVPKAASAAHREENAAVFDFELDAAEMEQISALDEGWSSLAGLPYA